MKFQPTTIVLVLVALLLGGVVLVTTRQSADQPGTESAEASDLFDFTEDQVQSFTLETPLQSLAFEKDAEGIWQMTEPETVPASDASIAYLLDLLATGSSTRAFTAPVGDREDFGFHQPLATITVTLDDQETHTLVLGEYDLTRTARYALVDSPTPDPEELTISLVSPNFENAVSRPLDEWKQSEEAE